MILTGLLGDELHSAIREAAVVISTLFKRLQVSRLVPSQGLRFLERFSAVTADEANLVAQLMALETSYSSVRLHALLAAEQAVVGKVFVLVDEEASPGAEYGSAFLRAAADPRQAVVLLTTVQ